MIGIINLLNTSCKLEPNLRYLDGEYMFGTLFLHGGNMFLNLMDGIFCQMNYCHYIRRAGGIN